MDLLKPVPHEQNPAVRQPPAEGSWTEMLRGGDRIRIRPIHENDAEMEKKFIEGLSPVSRRFRFQYSMVTPGEGLLALLTHLDPRNDVAFVAVLDDKVGNNEVGVARLAGAAVGNDCEFAVVVGDKWQNKGVGTHLMRHLLVAARKLGITRIHSSDASDNHLMRNFARHLHLDHTPDPDDAGRVVYSTMVNKAADRRRPA